MSLDIINKIIQIIDWLNVFAGVFLTVFVSHISPKLFNFAVTVINDKYNSYYGEYIVYNWSGIGENKIVTKNLSISKSLFGQPRVTFNYTGEKNRDYKGTLYISRSLLVIDLKGSSHGEVLRIIFHEPINSCLSPNIGIISGCNINREPASGKVFVSNTHVSEETVIKILDTSTNNIMVSQSDVTNLRSGDNKVI